MSSGVKSFYRQRKNKPIDNKSKKPPVHAASFGENVIQPTSLASRNDEYKESEVVLRQFDLNMAYGPCIGMTRLARWERARKLGLNPPQEIENLLKTGEVQQDSLWEGRI